MTDILIRGVSAKALKDLKSRAKQNGRSLQSEVKTILEASAKPTLAESVARAAMWRKKLGRTFSDSTLLIREDRDR
jgi:plasmid stability protein